MENRNLYKQPWCTKPATKSPANPKLNYPNSRPANPGLFNNHPPQPNNEVTTPVPKPSNLANNPHPRTSEKIMTPSASSSPLKR
jgi:hypothetical protein